MFGERTPGERLRMCTGMFGTAKALARAGITLRRGALGEREMRLELFRRLYGSELRPVEQQAIVAALREAHR